ncbi:MAG: TolC family protein, partial [Bacteroidales bacterium]|nr:TolC family protein [Bacteroidales bacterium]
LRIVRDGYDAGTLSMSDLLQAQLLYQQSRDKYTESYSQLKISEAEWKLAGGE